MNLGISEIFAKINNEPDENQRKNMLASLRNNQGIITILKLAYDPEIKFNLPEGDPPYKPCGFVDQQGMLYNNIRRLYLFWGNGNPGITPTKRQALFISMLEALDPDDAKLVLAMKSKRLPYKNITPALVGEVFPGLLSSIPEHVIVDEVEAVVKRPVGRPRIEREPVIKRPVGRPAKQKVEEVNV